MTELEFNEAYRTLSHALQTGVRIDQEVFKSQDGSPNHLRVGLNLRARDHTALVKLLIAKKLITDEEYFDAVIEQLKTEVAEYEARLSALAGKNIVLH